MQWYLMALKRYAEFSGRSRRKEYWWFTLANFLIGMLLSVLDMALGTLDAESGFGLLSGLYMLAVLIPGLAVTIRRLHDVGKSGWWIFINLIPLIGALVFLLFMVRDSEEGDNRYGANPKEPMPAEVAGTFA